MVDTESGSSVGGVRLETAQVQAEQLKEVSENKSLKEKMTKAWKRNIETAKAEFKRKLVGGEEKYKSKLEEIIQQTKEELEEIKKKPEKERKKAVEELEKKQEKEIRNLMEEIEREAKGASDKEVDKQVEKKGGDVKEVWQKLKKFEESYKQFDEELEKRKPNIERLQELQNELEENQNSLVKAIESWDYKGPLQIRYFFEQEVGAEIAKLKGEASEAEVIGEKVKLLRFMATGKQPMKIEEIAEVKAEVASLKQRNILSETEAERLTRELETVTNSLGARKKFEAERQTVSEELKTEGLRRFNPAEVAQYREKHSQLKLVPDDEVERIMMAETAGMKEIGDLLKKGGEEAWNEVGERVKKIETRKKEIDDQIEIAKMIGDLANGRYHDVTEAYRRYYDAVASPFAPEELMKDAKRLIAKAAIMRIAEEGEGARLEVTNEDVENWVRERLEFVIGGGGEATGYSTRQFLGEIAWILSSKDLNFKEIAGEMRLGRKTLGEGDDRMEMVTIMTGRGEVPLAEAGKIDVAAIEEQSKKFIEGNHVVQVHEHFKDQINAALIHYEIGHAYDGSGGPEDLVRIMRHLKTPQTAEMLSLENARKKVAGRLKFEEVELDKYGRRKVLRIEDMNVPGREVWGGMHSAEARKGDLTMIIKGADGGELKRIEANNFEDWLTVEGEIAVTPGDILDLMQQQRFISGLLNRGKKVREKFGREVVKEAMMLKLGLIDVDGELNIGKLQQLVEKKYGSGAKFEWKSGSGETLTTGDKRVRLNMITERVGDKAGLKQELFGRGEVETLRGKVVVGGIQESEGSLDNVFNEHVMVYELAHGYWQASGMAVTHDRTRVGEVKDWHWYIVQLPYFCSGYGIGSGHFWDVISLDYGDFPTRVKGDLLPQFSEVLMKGAKGVDPEFQRGELIHMVMTNWDNVLLTRDKMMDVYGLGSKKEIEDRIYGRLLDRVKYRWGDSKGELILRKHWDDIKEADWSGVIGEAGLPPAETRGFKGLYNMVKRNYRYADLGWGLGDKPNDRLWNNKYAEEAAHLVTNQEYKNKMMGWMGKAHDVGVLADTVKTPGNYGKVDHMRKAEVMELRSREFFKRAGIPPFDVVKTIYGNYNPHTNVINPEGKGYDIDEWDGTVKYRKNIMAPGTCIATQLKGMKPFSYSQFEERAKQLDRAIFKTGYGLEFLGEVTGTGIIEQWMDLQADKVPLLKGPLKAINTLLFGKIVNGFNIDLGGKKLRFWRQWRWEGVVGYFWKWIWKWINDTWAVKSEIWEGVKGAAGEQIGGAVKEAGGG